MFELFMLFRKTRVILMAVGLLVSGTANAADIRWVAETGKDGFSVMVPGINIGVLLDDLAIVKSELGRQEKIFADKVELRRVSSGDNILSLLMPGGLLYAAYKRDVYARAVEEHNQLRSDYHEISTDLARMKALVPTVVVVNR